jgi:hypothetical protein
LLRPDLPLSIEKIILKALSKRPVDRYKSAQDMAIAFRQALIGTGLALGQLAERPDLFGLTTSARLYVPQLVADQSRQSAKMKVPAATMNDADAGVQFRPTGRMPAVKDAAVMPVAESDLSRPTGAFPLPDNRGGLLSKTGMFPAIVDGSIPSNRGGLSTTSASMPSARMGGDGVPQPTDGAIPAPRAGSGLLSRTGRFPAIGSPATEAQPDARGSYLNNQFPSPDIQQQLSPLRTTNTGSLQNDQGPRMTMKLSTSMKVVKVPVAGQPGQFVTGLLSMNNDATFNPTLPEKKRPMPLWARIGIALLALLLISGAAGGTWVFLHGQKLAQKNLPLQAVSTPNATATAQANTILADPLDHNIHGWYESATDGYVFTDGAYHIINHNADKSSATVLPSFSYTGSMAYTITLQELKGDDTSDVNSFGMILRYVQQTAGKNVVSKFYSFEVLNKPGGEYKFWKYDSSKGAGAAAWGDPLWHQPFGSEFHQGHGAQAINTFKVVMDGSKFTLIVNGKTIKTLTDTTYANGSVGMIVNLNGTEVAFKNLLLTKN